MPDLKKYREQVLLLLSRLTRMQQIVLLTGGILLLGGLVYLIIWLTTPSYSVLFADLSPEDASAILQKLKDNKVGYKIANGGAAILVPSEIVYEQRLALECRHRLAPPARRGEPSHGRQDRSTAQVGAPPQASAVAQVG